jgi:septal ring factor EnvC (AmiA/AmiB activator)
LTTPQARAAALADVAASYEERLEEERAANAALQARLKEALDRSTRMRQHAERERRGLQAQVEKLKAGAEAAARESEARESEAAAVREAQAAEWEARVEAERTARVGRPEREGRGRGAGGGPCGSRQH